MPVTGSSFVLRCAIVQEGVIRRSDEEAVDVIRRGTSRVVVMFEAMTDKGLARLICSIFYFGQSGRLELWTDSVSSRQRRSCRGKNYPLAKVSHFCHTVHINNCIIEIDLCSVSCALCLVPFAFRDPPPVH